MRQKGMKIKTPQAENWVHHQQSKCCNVWSCFHPKPTDPRSSSAASTSTPLRSSEFFQPQIIHCFPPRCSNLFYPYFPFVKPRRLRMKTQVTQVLIRLSERKLNKRIWVTVPGGLVGLTVAFCRSEISTDNPPSSFCCNMTWISNASSLKLNHQAEDVSDYVVLMNSTSLSHQFRLKCQFSTLFLILYPDELMNCTPRNRQNQTFERVAAVFVICWVLEETSTQDVNTDFHGQIVHKIRGIVVLFLADMFHHLITDFFYSNVWLLF